jgi:hypothetical protein
MAIVFTGEVALEACCFHSQPFFDSVIVTLSTQGLAQAKIEAFSIEFPPPIVCYFPQSTILEIFTLH